MRRSNGGAVPLFRFLWGLILRSLPRAWILQRLPLLPSSSAFAAAVNRDLIQLERVRSSASAALW